MDGLGSTRALVNSSGAVTDTYTYDAFGDLTGGTQVTTNPYQYAGYEHDTATGLDHLGARYYEASAGRFTSRDSFDGQGSNLITINKYIYSNDNPTFFTDPTGHEGDIGSQGFTATLGSAIAAFGNLGTFVLTFALRHPITTFVITSAISATGVFEGIPPGDPTPFDELAAYGRLLRGGVAGVRSVIPGKVFLVDAAPDGLILTLNKFNYFFGRVVSNQHNKDRSKQMVANLATLGIEETEEGVSKLIDVFRQGLLEPEVARFTNNFGTTITRTVKIGTVGAIDVKYFYEDGNLFARPQISTIIPKIFKPR